MSTQLIDQIAGLFRYRMGLPDGAEVVITELETTDTGFMHTFKIQWRQNSWTTQPYQATYNSATTQIRI